MAPRRTAAMCSSSSRTSWPTSRRWCARFLYLPPLTFLAYQALLPAGVETSEVVGPLFRLVQTEWFQDAVTILDQTVNIGAAKLKECVLDGSFLLWRDLTRLLCSIELLPLTDVAAGAGMWNDTKPWWREPEAMTMLSHRRMLLVADSCSGTRHPGRHFHANSFSDDNSSPFASPAGSLARLRGSMDFDSRRSTEPSGPPPLLLPLRGALDLIHEPLTLLVVSYQCSVRARSRNGQQQGLTRCAWCRYRRWI